MTCGAIMTENPLTAHESDTVAEAAARLIEHRYINLPVVDGAGKFLGLFGIYDIFRLVIPRVALAGGILPNLRFMGDDAEEVRARFREAGTFVVSLVSSPGAGKTEFLERLLGRIGASRRQSHNV